MLDMDIPLHVLRYFCVLAHELHFGRAAAALNISAPSLSQQISRLEKTIGVQLFERSPRKVELTQAGVELLPLARRVRDDHADVIGWARERQRASEGYLLRVGVVAAGAGALTTATLTTAMERMPQLRIEMRRLGFFDTVSELLAGRVDIAFAPGPIDADDRIRIEPLWSEPRVLVVPAGHRFASRESITIDETNDEVFIAASGDQRAIIDWWVVDPRPDGTHPRRGPVADDIEGLLELVATGAGVNIAAAGASKHYARAELAFIPITDIEPNTILLCTLEHTTNRAVQVFESIASELAPDIPPSRYRVGDSLVG
jgi:DNA-binding transcriptional LysR family regulator